MLRATMLHDVAPTCCIRLARASPSSTHSWYTSLCSRGARLGSGAGVQEVQGTYTTSFCKACLLNTDLEGGNRETRYAVGRLDNNGYTWDDIRVFEFLNPIDIFLSKTINSGLFTWPDDPSSQSGWSRSRPRCDRRRRSCRPAQRPRPPWPPSRRSRSRPRLPSATDLQHNSKKNKTARAKAGTTQERDSVGGISQFQKLLASPREEQNKSLPLAGISFQPRECKVGIAISTLRAGLHERRKHEHKHKNKH